MIRIVNEDLRSSILGFVNDLGDGIKEQANELLNLYKDMIDNNEKLKSICTNPKYTSDKKYAGLISACEQLYGGSNKCFKQIGSELKLLSSNIEKEEQSSETETESMSLADYEAAEDELQDEPDDLLSYAFSNI